MKWFNKLAHTCAMTTGSPYAFIFAMGLVAAWIISGPFLRWSDTWQLVANTATTIITTLLVLLIQHTQNVNDTALHKKLDEIIRAIDKADNTLIGIEDDIE